MGTAKVCVIVGVGPGNGSAIARRFADEGFTVALLARSTETIESLATALMGARAYACDITDEGQVAATFDAIARDLGPVSTLVFNAAYASWGTVDEVDPKAFETSFRVSGLGLLLTAKMVVPQMKAGSGGSIIVIGSPASRRGAAGSATFAAAKAAQRGLAESMARELWPQRIHVSLVVIDGVLDLPRTRSVMKDKPDEFFIDPEAVADAVLYLVDQHLSAWTFDLELRPFGAKW